MKPPLKQSWLERVILVHRWHIEQLRINPNHTIKDSAEQLGRSVGSVSQDLLIADWLKSHKTQLVKFRHLRDALEFVRKKKAESKLFEVDI